MKINIKEYLRILRDGLQQVARRHPVECVIALLLCIGGFIAYQTEDTTTWIATRMPVLGLFLWVSFIVNNLAEQSVWRKVYWVCWLPVVPLAVWTGLEDWYETVSFVLTASVLTPLALLLSRRALANERFVCDAIVWLRSAVLAVFFAYVTLGLFCAILYSTTYIFGLEGAWINDIAIYALILTSTLAVPALFMMMCDRWKGAECTTNRVFEVLINYIVTPALLIYTGILMLYLIKIVATWSLPRGGVAYMVFGFMILSIIIQSLQFLLEKRPYKWFFDRFSLISLPLLLLFWAGVIRRVDEYGLTSARVYLLVCGGIMTLCILLFLSRRVGRLYFVCLAAFLVFAAIAYIPVLNPRTIAAHSQVKRADRMAAELGVLGADGKIDMKIVAQADSTQRESYRRLYEALDYIDNDDSVTMARLGIESSDDLLEPMSAKMVSYCRWGEWGDEDDYYDYTNYNRIEAPENMVVILDGVYPKMYSSLVSWSDEAGYTFSNDTLYLNMAKPERWRISAAALLQRQLEVSGYDPASGYITDEQAVRMMDYRDEYCRIVFSNMNLQKRDSTYVLDDVTINVILTR